MGSHSVALISFARCNIPHVFNLCLQNQLIFDKAFQKSIIISKFLISIFLLLTNLQLDIKTQEYSVGGRVAATKKCLV
jgi:hypothetical protein